MLDEIVFGPRRKGPFCQVCGEGVTTLYGKLIHFNPPTVHHEIVMVMHE